MAADPLGKLRHDIANPLAALLTETQLLLLDEQALGAVVLDDEVEAGAPDPVPGAAHRETDGDTLTIETDGWQIVQQRFRRLWGHRPNLGERHRIPPWTGVSEPERAFEKCPSLKQYKELRDCRNTPLDRSSPPG